VRYVCCCVLGSVVVMFVCMKFGVMMFVVMFWLLSFWVIECVSFIRFVLFVV